MKKIFLSVALLSSVVFVNAQNTSPYWSLSGNNNATRSSKLGTTNDYGLRFYTNNIQRMIINSPAGFVGIGTPSPTERLHVNSALGTNAFRAQVNGYTKFLVHSQGGVTIGTNATPPTNGLFVAGNVGIGTGIPSSKLHVVGHATITNGITVTSERDLYADELNIGVKVKADDYGVFAESAGQVGVYGSGQIGVEGKGDSYGVYATSGPFGFGVFSEGGSTGVFGKGNGAGVSGYSLNGTGVYGSSDSQFGGDFYSATSSGIRAVTNSGKYAAEFEGDVKIIGELYKTSDKTLKKNIREFENAMSIINKLKPKSYEFKNDGKYTSLHLPKGNHYGLIAQELEEVLPDLVKESRQEVGDSKVPNFKQTPGGKPAMVAQEKEAKESINIKAVNYIELIPIIIKAMQEQAATIQQQVAENKEQNATILKQNATIEALTQLVNKLSQNAPSVKLSGASLGQSTPNPNSTNARISYNIPTGFTRAELVINNEAGQKVKQIALTKSGWTDVDTSKLIAGTYFYSLYVNGTSVDTKKMLVIRY
jgi:urease gamma subunit